MRRAKPTGAKLWLFRGLAVFLPIAGVLAILLVAETILRIAGVAEPEPLFVEVETPTQHKYQTNGDVAMRDFPPALARIMPSPGFQAFDVEKPDGLLRVFCLGASTTAGFPYPQHLAYPALLAEKLRFAIPDRVVEVVNCGMSAVASFTLVDFTREVLDYEPDIVIVYTGHNEFYGAWGAASTAGPGGAPAWLLGPMRWVQKLRLWRWWSARIGEAKIEPGTLMERMVARPAVAPGGALYKKALTDYAKNIRRMIRLCRKKGVPIIFCEAVSNLSGHYPFGTLMPGDFQSAQEKRLDLWQTHRQARDREITMDEAYDHWRALIADDTLSADLWFHGGWISEFGGRDEESLRAYTKARDLDTVRFRAGSDFIEALRDVCREESVPVVPLTDVFQSATRRAAPGNDLFVEHLHPTLEGHDLIADAIGDVLASMPWPDAQTNYALENEPGPWMSLQMAGLTPLDARFADLRVEQLEGRWPYENPLGKELSRKERFLLADPLRLYQPASIYGEAHELWRQAETSRDPGDEPPFGEAIPWTADPEEAVDIVAARALSEDANILEGHRQLGEHYEHIKRFAEAFREFRAAIRLFPVDPRLYFQAGQMLAKAGYYGRARNYFYQSLNMSPGVPEIMAAVADAEIRSGRLDAGRVWVERLLAVNPDSPQANDLLKLLDREQERESVRDREGESR